MSRVEGFSVGSLWSSGTAGCMRCKLDFNAKMAVVGRRDQGFSGPEG